MSRKRYNRKKCRQLGGMALAMSAIAVALLAGTWIFLQRELAQGHHTHVSLQLVAADVVLPLLALWLTLEWVRYRRGLKKTPERKT
ncbi:MAG: hypothetical protein PHG55_00440 [Verrucomicrobiota bacterium]|nr:hypothetical protein [Verrucomicrobiota bacterium]MDD8049782.1 hypothetical protein [Verrucomicrobiota bacterium]